MSFFVQSTPAPIPKTKRVASVGILYAAIVTIMALGQLYTFDSFITLITSFHLPVSEAVSYAIAPVIIALEIAAIPFLLRMRLSPAFRVLSMVSGWGVACIWLTVTLWIVSTRQDVTTVGFIGDIGELVPGVWAILFSISLGILSAWASWGMWPFAAKRMVRKN